MHESPFVLAAAAVACHGKPFGRFARPTRSIVEGELYAAFARTTERLLEPSPQTATS